MTTESQKVLLFAGAAAAGLLVVAVMLTLAAGWILFDRLTVIDRAGGIHPDNTPPRFSVTHGISAEIAEAFDPSPWFIFRWNPVEFTASDGATLSAWHCPGDPGAPAVVLVHGMGDSKSSHQVLIPAGMLWREGFTVLLLDVREHGDSAHVDGRTAIGSEEYLDVLAARDWLAAETGLPKEKIGFFGVSLGAVTALAAAGEDESVPAVFADSAFSSSFLAIREELARNGYPRFIARAGLLVGRLRGVNLVARSPDAAVRRMSGRRVFITHGESDIRIGVAHGRELDRIAREAGVRTDSWFVPEADHVQAMVLRPEEYGRRLVGFFRDAFAAQPTESAAEPQQP